MFEFVELGDKGVGVVGAAVGIFGEQSIDDVIAQIGRHVVGQRGRGRLHVHENRRQKRIFFEWRVTCEHFIENDAQRIDVATRIEFFAARLLGAHIFGRSRCRANFRQLPLVFVFRLLEFGNPEIEHLHDIELGEKDIIGLEIAVNNAL